MVLLPAIAATALVVLARDGRPVFFRTERMRAPGRPFRLLKFRTMRNGSDDGGITAGHKSVRVTPTGRFLRRYRLDEIPQLWNILAGDMSFVGPRPPLRAYVERFPELYARVLQAKPGVTGYASLVYHAREEALLAGCRSPEEADRVYSARCVPAKARLDIAYERRRTLRSDLGLICATVARVGRGRPSARPGRRASQVSSRLPR